MKMSDWTFSLLIKSCVIFKHFSRSFDRFCIFKGFSSALEIFFSLSTFQGVQGPAGTFELKGHRRT
jgi:hypothetical protein